MKLLTLFFACLLLSTGSWCQTIRYVKPAATGTATGSSWANASSNLQAIINASAPNDQVWVAGGDYQPALNSSFTMKDAVKMYGHFAGTETALSQRNLSDSSVSNLIGNGNTVIDNNSNGLTIATLLNGFTVKNGSGNAFGGGIRIINVSITISNCTFSSNVARKYGGGVYVLNSTCSLSNCLFVDNIVVDGFNVEEYGGGVFTQDAALIITDCIFTHNQAIRGGGLFNINSQTLVIDCLFRDNETYFYHFTESGGAIYTQGTPIAVYNSVFTYNKALNGGAIHNNSANSQYVNCIFIGNKHGATNGRHAAAIKIDEPCNVVNSTFTLNGLTGGGSATGTIAITSGVSPVISNCIFWGNNSNKDIEVNSSNPVITNCNIQNGTNTGTGITNINPRFVNEANSLGADGKWGTADDGLRLQCTSPLVNAGNNATITATGIILDIGGAPRVQHIVDMGPYERPNVPNLRVYVKQGGSGTKDGNSWGNASDNLQATINRCNCLDTVLVAKGTYTPPAGESFTMKQSVRIMGHFAGTETYAAQQNLSTADTSFLKGANASVIRNDNNGLDSLSVLDGFTIKDGRATNGAGIYNNNVAPVISHCIFENNISTTAGGGMYNVGPVSPNITSCVFRNNTSNVYGGGIANENASTKILSSVFEGNTASAGAGIRNNNCTGSLTIGSCVFINNNSNVGGAIANAASPVTIANCTISGNTAPNDAAVNNLNSNTVISNNIIWNNSAAIANNGSTPVVNYNNVQGGVLPGNGNISENPGFVNAANPKGADNTWGTADDGLQPACAAPIINAGNNGYTPAIVKVDMTGAQRTWGQVDMGAYEFVSSLLGKLFVTPAGAGTKSGTSWANATDNLQTAINNAFCSHDSVFIAKGTYTPTGQSFEMKEGVKIYGHFAGNEAFLTNRNLLSADTTFLRGNSGTVVNNNNNGLTAKALLDGVTITNGTASTGGGMRNSYSSPLIRNCIFQNNTAGTDGGGAYNFNSSPVFDHCIFRNNTAVSGGGMLNMLSGTQTSYCVFDNNTASNNGGAMGNFSSTVLLVANSIFNNNASPLGSAVYNNFSPINFVNNNLTNNRGANGSLHISVGANVNISNSIIWGNESGILVPGTAPTISYSNVQGGVPAGTGNISTDPVFVNIANPVGPDGIWGTNDDGLRIRCGTATINTGNNGLLPAFFTTDFSGYNRIYNSVIDMGAYETIAIVNKKIYVKQGSTGNADGTSWANATADLQWAIDRSVCGGDSVFVAKGMYKPLPGQSFMLREGVKIFGHFAGTEASLKDRVLNSKDSTVLKGSGASVINNDNNGLTTATLLDGFVITGGSGSQGGGIRNYSASPGISNCHFIANSATEGGAIYAYMSTFPVTNCTFANNTSGGNGAATYSLFSTLIISNSTFAKNTGGACIYGVNGGLQLRNSIVWGNTEGVIAGGLGGATITYSNVQGGILAGAGNKSIDPLFANTNNIAGSDGVMGTKDDGLRLSCGSPAKDAGSNALVPAGATTDIKGSVRIKNSTADMGAYESAEPILFVAPTGSGINDGSNWANALGENDLQWAIDEACAGDSVFVAKGIYTQSISMKDGVKIYGHFAGTETALSQRNLNSADISILQSTYNPPTEIYGATVINNYRNGVTQSAVLDGFTIRRGFGFLLGGGGMRNEDVSPTVRNCIFENNSAEYLGSAIYQEGQAPGGPPVFENCIIRNNDFDIYALGVAGAVYINNASPVINRCVFDNNHGPSGFGSGDAVDISGPGHPMISNTIFVNHGLPVSISSGAGATFTNCTLAKNTGEVFRIYGSSQTNTFFNSSVFGENRPYYIGSATFSHTIFQTDTINQVVQPGTNNVNPLFVNANDPDGPDNIWGTADDGLRLQCASPGINTGSNDLVPAGINLDQAAATRIQNESVDMGAYENATPPFTNLSTANDTARQFHIGTISYGVCGNLIATVSAAGTTPLRGITVAKVWREAAQPADYVKRHYEIKPDSNAAVATGRVTLYFTQQEFNDYNAVNMLKLPTGPTDATGKANLVIEKRGGTSSNGSGLPATYPGAPVIINLADAAIVWNTTASRWEVSFDVTGFSGFFAKSENNTCPLIFSVTQPTCSVPTGSITVSSPTGANITYSINGTDYQASPMFSGLAPRGYVVTAKNSSSGCYILPSDSIYLVPLPTPGKPTITANGTTTFCAGGRVTLTTSAAFKYVWSTGDTTQAISISQGGAYSVVVRNSNGCNSPASDAVTVTVNALPAKPVVTASGPTTFTQGDSVILTAPAGFAAYGWSSGATTRSIIVKQSGTYSVTVTNSNGCNSSASNAVVVTVNTPVIIYVTTSGAGDLSGSSWANAASASLFQSKINGAANGTRIWVKEGVYYPTTYPTGCTNCNTDRDKNFLLKNGVAIYGGFAGTETALSQRQLLANPTVLSGNIGNGNNNNDNSYHVVLSVGNNATAVLDGFGIVGGNANGTATRTVTGQSISQNAGAGVYNQQSSPTLANCTISLNTSSGSGGGMVNVASSPAITNCIITLNNSNTNGGGLSNGAGSAPVLTNAFFILNQASGSGGGLYNAGTVTLNKGSFRQNNSTTGGGMANAGGAATISGVVFDKNSSTTGGAMANNNTSQIAITNCVFSYNSGTTGGAVYNSGSSPKIVNSTFYTKATGSSRTLYNTNANPSITNSIIWSNSSGSGIQNQSGTPAISYSIVKGGYAGTGNSSADPLFLEANNTDGDDYVFGTADDGLQLQAGSPAINSGSNAALPAGTTTDFTGAARIQSGRVDMGAYEYNAIASMARTNSPTQQAIEVVESRSSNLPAESLLLTAKQEVSVYPNPNNGQFTVQLNNPTATKADVQIVDSKGTVVERKVVQLVKGNQTLSFNLSIKASGMYLVKVTDGKGIQTVKMMVQR